MKKLIHLFIISFLLISCEEEIPTMTYTLTTQVTPTGSGSVNPSGGTFEEKETLSVSAMPSMGYRFKQWSGEVSSYENPLVFDIMSNTSIVAEFEFIDADNDGITDALDQCPDTPSGITVNSEGCAASQIDSDGDGVTDDKDKCANTLENTDVNDDGCPYIYLDENGVTLKAILGTPAGSEAYLDGELYTVVDRSMLIDMIKNGEDLSKVVTSLLTDMYNLFRDNSEFNQDISSWDVSNVTNFQYMFLGATSFDQDISDWNVGKAVNMIAMFGETSSFNHPLNNWNVGNVKYFNSMFYDSKFNQDIGNWDVSNVEDMGGMFWENKYFNKSIENWNVSNVMSMVAMFSSASAFNQDISNWDVSNVKDMSTMFMGASTFNQNIGGWDVSNTSDFYMMFKDATAFNQDLSGWCVSKVTSEPTDFSLNSGLSENNEPIWGTCPTIINSYTISVSANSFSDYTLSGSDRNGNVSGEDPDLNFKVGDEIVFSINAIGHPFYLKTLAGTGTDNQVDGAINNGTSNGSISWKPNEAGTYYYQCSLHSGMVGIITVDN